MRRNVIVALVSMLSMIAVTRDARSKASPDGGHAAASGSAQAAGRGSSDQNTEKADPGTLKPPTKPPVPPGCGPTSGCRASLATRMGSEWKWLDVPLSNDEQASLANAFATAKSEQTPHVHLRLKGKTLEFVPDTAAAETPNALKDLALLKVDDTRLRIVPEGTAYGVLSQRVKASAGSTTKAENPLKE